MHEAGLCVRGRIGCGVLPAIAVVLALALSGCVGVPQAGPEAGPPLAPGYGYTCYAGAYVCRLPQQVPQGAQCTCPGIGAPSYGTVR